MVQTDNRRNAPFSSAIVVGVTTWIIGLFLTGVLVTSLRPDTLVHYTEIDPVYGIGYLYISMHAWLLNALLRAGNEAYALLPILLLTGAGYGLTVMNQTAEHPGSTTGAAVVLGYLPMAVITTILVYDSRLPFEPLVPFVWAGFIFPVVFGAIGGWIADRT